VHLSPEPPAAGTISTQKGVVPKPVSKMKRTGGPTLPHATPVRDTSRSTPATSHGPYTEPEPARIISDILPPPSTPTPDPTTLPEANSAPNAARKTKYATDEERRRATSLALKGMSAH
jgi:hypothetical protein